VTLGDEATECVWVTTVRYPHAARIVGSRWAHIVTNWKNWGWLDLNTKALFVQDWGGLGAPVLHDVFSYVL
jgi:hypothetical protein